MPSCGSCKLGTVGRRAASQHVDGVIGLSRDSLNRHLEEGLFRNALTTIIPNPIPTPDGPVEPRHLTRPPIFGYLGFLTPNKGLELMADALRAEPILQRNRLLIAGKGEPAYVAGLKERFAGLNVEFIGWRESHVFLNDIDLLVVPSIFMEPFGRIVAEAFTSGVPVIGSRIGGIGDMVTPDYNGALFTPADVQALRYAMLGAARIGADTYNNWSANALESAKQFTGLVVAKRSLAFFRTVL